MRLIMTCLVRDEQDLLADWIRFHQAQGVDHFLMIDHRSVDGSTERLAEFADRGLVTVWSETRLDYQQGQWMTWLARLACSHFQADWVINNDADEFWLAPQGTLKQFLTQVPSACRVVSATRHNFAALWPDPAPPFWQSQIYRFREPVNFIGQPLAGKVCHRATPDIIVHDGNHSVTPMAPADLYPDQALEILHVPARNYAQFERKISLGAALTLDRDKGGYRAKRELYQIYLRGQLRPWYLDWSYDATRLTQALASGELVVDTRLRDCLQK